MSDYSKYRDANQKLWDEFARLHFNLPEYGKNKLLDGGITLDEYEMEELGSVKGKRILHLMCHFGLDSLSWARLGAEVTGVDFSKVAVDYARKLAETLNLPSNFIQADIYELADTLSGKYDIVYTSKGVLAWLSDLNRWAKIIDNFLKPNGIFYINEFHPIMQIFDDSPDAASLIPAYPYFEFGQVMEFDTEGSYADRKAEIRQRRHYQWNHKLCDILNALAEVGLSLTMFNEHPFCVYDHFPAIMEENPSGIWKLKGGYDWIPLMFSLKARKIK